MNPNQTFINLNRGLTDAYVLWDGKNYTTIHANLTDNHYTKHLEGKHSLGIVPITRDGNCRWAIIDDDSHKADKTKPIQKYNYKNLLKKLKLLGIVATVFKSKNGGAHIKLNFDKPYPAKKVRRYLKKIAYQICESSYDLLPKQDELGKEETGTCINLPYHNGNTRVVIDDEGNELNLQKGMEYESNRVVKLEDLEPFNLLSTADYPDGRNNKLHRVANFFKKNFPENWQDNTREYNKSLSTPLDATRLENTVIASVEKKLYANDKEPEEVPRARIYNMVAYRALGIKKPIFIIERLFKDKSINYEFGPKGTGKTEFALGLANALARGKPFLDGKYDCPKPYPVLYVDFEMDSYDILERDIPYQKYYGGDAGDYFQLLNWEVQVEQNIPDIQGEAGQNFILGALEEQKELVGKPPLLVIDNLRSASGYDENDSNDWRPIGKWFLKLKGLKYPSLILDHTGYDESHMRGTSSKSDWSYVNMGLKSRRVKGNPNMVIDIFFDKARGLIPSETDKFAVEYDFNGKWSLTKGKQEVRDGELCAQIIELRKADPRITQLKLSEILEVSTGTISKLCKKLKDN